MTRTSALPDVGWMTNPVIEISRSHNPFSQSGMTRGANGRAQAQYTDVPATLVDMLRGQLNTRPDAEAIVELGGDRLTYAQLWARASTVAGGLRANGVQRGDRVAIRCPAGTNWVLAFWGTLMAGGIAVAVNTRATQPEMDFVLDDAGARFDLTTDAPLPHGDPYVAEDIHTADLAALFYTSAATGNPKGVQITHQAFVTNAENVLRCVGVPRISGSALRTLIYLPLFEVTACASQLIGTAHVGGTSVIMSALELPEVPGVLAAERISFLVARPAMYYLLLRQPGFAEADVSAMRIVGCGGAPITPALVHALKAAFPLATVINGYGMTETTSLITVRPDQDTVEHADSVGYAVPSVDIGVLPIGDDPAVGELVVRGPNVTTGYWHRPDATTETIVDGWLRTGDIVRVDDAGRVRLLPCNSNEM